MYVNRVEPGEPAGFLKNQWTGRYLVNRPVFEKNKNYTRFKKKKFKNMFFNDFLIKKNKIFKWKKSREEKKMTS